MKLDKAFPATPSAFEDAITKGIRKGEKRMKLKNKLRVASLAACFIACIVLVGYAAGTGDRTDTTVSPTPDTQSTGFTAAAVSTAAVSPTPDPQETMFSVVTVSPTPLNAGWPGIQTDEEIVYMTEFGVWYHTDQNCQGMQGAMAVPISEAWEEGKFPCPICTDETVYATTYGKFYHSDPNCSGMQNADEWKVQDAEVSGKLPCPTCLRGRSINLNSYGQKALDALENVFPGCVEALAKHYNVDQLFADPWIDNSCVRVNLNAGSVTVAEVSFDGSETQITFQFGDIEIRGKVMACEQEDTLSDKLNELYPICKYELIDGIMNTIQNSVRTGMPVSSEYFNLMSMSLTFYESECQTAQFNFATQYHCEASFIFDLVEGDALRSVELHCD